MKPSKKRINKGLIVLNKGERIAVISLLTLISILLAFSVFRPVIKLTKKERMAFHNLDSLIAVQEEALRKERYEAEKKTAPISVTEQKPESHKPKKTYQVSQYTENESKSYPKEVKSIPILDLNQADSSALVALPQIGEVMASRIHRYRSRLGGFVSMEQLYEIRGMDTARFEAIKPYIILEANEITKINVNQDEFKALLRHPYLEYEQVKAIVNHRERKGLIKDWTQLNGIVGDVNPRLKEYISY
jgi:DNA uptake protein ComE-like DNA-binding protein